MDRSISRAKAIVILTAAIMMTLLFGTLAVHATSSGTIVRTSNQVTLTNYKTDEPLHLAGDTTVILNGENEFNIYGSVAIDGDSITFKGTGSLKLNRVLVANSVTLDHVKLDIDTTEQPAHDGSRLPAFDVRNITIKGGSVSAKTAYPYTVGLYSDTGALNSGDWSSSTSSITISDGAVVEGIGSICFMAKTITIDNSTVNAISDGSVVPMPDMFGITDYGMVCDSFSAKNAKIKATGKRGGIAAMHEISLTHTYVEAESFEKYSSTRYAAALGIYIATSDSVRIGISDAAIKTPAGGVNGVYMQKVEGGIDQPFPTILDGSTPSSKVVIEPNHKWDAGKVTKPATAAADGVKTYTCTVCGDTWTEAIPKTGGSDGTAFGPGADASAAEASILALPDDKDPKGTTFGILQLKAAKTTKSSIKLTWKKAPGAKKYIIYANACGKGKKYQKLTTVTGKSYTVKKVVGKKLAKGKYYKFLMVAVDANNKVVSTSKTVHAATAGGKVGNPTKVTTKAKKNKVTVKAKKTFKLAAKQTGKKIKKHRIVSFETSNAKVATVSKKGVIKGVKKGKCFVYAYAQNGVCVKIKVTVK